ncbi:hypothetical protein [Paenibacillus eucommiae]|uniref:Transposase n=1 Tax=Paenibacillus eucommiae TaxID=1355755 RepID=A0ABS4J471_9BACL|nr:hypothetical protein [Paenibacillus eucommiae]MBP1994639.1 hypothetical protein [Paenibacillus eucommiae]
MNRIHPHLDEINMIGKLADLKDSHYHQSLLLSALIELLTHKGIITLEELTDKAQELNHMDNSLISP